MIRRFERVQESRVSDRVVLYHPDTGEAVTLNPAGTRLWDRLAAPAAEPDLVAWLAAGPGAPDAATAARDVRAFVERLLSHGLVTLDE